MSGPTLLIIDDDPVDRLAIRRALEQGGFADVDEVASGEDALAKLDGRRYDCLLLDQNLAGRDGIEDTKPAVADEHKPNEGEST